MEFVNVVQIPSVCLPRVYYKFDKNYVEQVFCEIFGPDNRGESCVERIDIIIRHDRNTNEPFHVVFVHFSEFMEPTQCVIDFSKRIIAQEEVKIQYDYPWFWKVRQNRNHNIQQYNNSRTNSGPRIMSKDDEQAIITAKRNLWQQYNNNHDQQETHQQNTPTTPQSTPPPSPQSTPPSNHSSRKSWTELNEEEE